MTSNKLSLPVASAIAIAAFLAGCSDGSPSPSPSAQAPAPGPAPTPVPTPAPTPANFNVTACLNQIAVPGRTVASLVVPDTLQLDLTQPAGFPNGRRYLDPVVDITLAAIFLDLRRHPVTTFAALPVNPNGIDQPLPGTFPFLAPPLGNPPTSNGAGSNFRFRTDPASAYVRVDRAGMPAVSTALVSGNPSKNAYNDDTPAIDATAKWEPELANTLTLLTNVLADDFQRLGLTICALPS
ncbi:hypothetical protein GCM10007973_27760 [Polymorphobacter multimanifer]|uniref:DUF4331 domain-containing protein n=1 Tax=Polymorphobacter multimanifer TaxID=1070431 RepID=A0A841LG72_9SPHN|nr:DUF4331 family protein [Polymorphobacter multimanifer]MBB6227968.1 hypothetical protein [Polymorphobacter multimanifer]GGI89822.1 hypothetical protein GCM10007973_27760 [Polymorphobacter multimanifer]